MMTLDLERVPAQAQPLGRSPEEAKTQDCLKLNPHLSTKLSITPTTALMRSCTPHEQTPLPAFVPQNFLEAPNFSRNQKTLFLFRSP